MDTKINPRLRAYVEAEIFPQYAQNDRGHHLDHIKYVLRRSLTFAESAAEHECINADIVYAAAAYHDIGHHIDAFHHEKVSADILRADRQLLQFFSLAEIKTIAEAIEDHRSKRQSPPRSLYGKILTSADCQIDIDTMLYRTYTYRIRNFSNLSLNQIIDEARKHLSRKYGSDGYARNKMHFIDQEFENSLRELQTLTADPRAFRQRFLKVNHLEHSFQLEQQYAEDMKTIDPELCNYIETTIFPQYQQNDFAHGISHIREVIRRAFVLNDSFALRLDPNLIYAIAAYHDIGKHLDSNHHERVSAELFLQDSHMSKFFSDHERRIISEAIADHRSRESNEPRSIYGKLISSADRNARIEMVCIRSFFVGKKCEPDTTIADFLDANFKRLAERYNVNHPENIFFADTEYKQFLAVMRELLCDEKQFKERYCAINQITSRSHTLAEEPGVELSPVILI